MRLFYFYSPVLVLLEGLSLRGIIGFCLVRSQAALPTRIRPLRWWFAQPLLAIFGGFFYFSQMFTTFTNEAKRRFLLCKT